MTIQTSIDQFEVAYEPDTVQINIRSRKRTWQILLLAAGLVAWLVGLAILGFLIYVPLDARAGESIFCVLALSVILFTMTITWAARGMIWAYGFLWQLSGREVIAIYADRITFQRTLLGVGRTREYRLDRITGVSVAHPLAVPFLFWGFKVLQFEIASRGSIKLEFQNRKAVYLGMGLPRGQARRVAELIQQQIFLHRP